MSTSWLGAISAAFFLLLSTATPATLVDNGGGLIYDNVLGITWTQPDNTLRTWSEAKTWAAGLTLGGANPGDWRLPYISVAAGAGPFTGSAVDCSTATEPACRDNELGYIFYQNLGGTSGSPILSSGDTDLALFPGLQSDYYWSGTQYSASFAWIFGFNDGTNDVGNLPGNTYYTWAVYDGNISPVPVPATVWLFGSGLLGLAGLARRKH